MKQAKVKIIIIGIIYLCIQVPVAILGINGIRPIDLFLTKPIVKLNINSQVLKEGLNKLYDCTTGEEFGNINLFFFDGIEDNKINVTYRSNMVSGRLEILDKYYSFETFDISNFILEKKEYKDEFYWIGKSEDMKMVIVGISNTLYQKPIPSSIYGNENQYYLCSIISDFYYNFIVKEQSSLPISNVIFYNINESYTSGIFFYDGTIVGDLTGGRTVNIHSGSSGRSKISSPYHAQESGLRTSPHKGVDHVRR